MKKFVGLIIILLLSGALSVYSQVTFSGVAINGTLATGNEVYGYYNCNPDTLSDPVFSFEWRSYDNSGGNEQVINDSTRSSLVIPSGLAGRKLKFFVTVKNSFDTASETGESSLSPVILGNSLPWATDVSIVELTNMNVGSVLLGSYTYNDTEGDLEGASRFKWYKDEDSGGSFTTEVGSGQKTYTIVMADTGAYFKFEVIPVAAVGNTGDGNPVLSGESNKVNGPPYLIGDVTVESSVTAGETITADYDYHDPDGDTDDSEFVWYRGTSIIGGANSNTYETVAEDGGSVIHVVVTPKSLDGYPDTGDPITSNNCTVSALGKPTVTGVCIDGERKAGDVLEGKYSGYNYVSNISNVNTKHRWFIGGVESSETSKNYTVQEADLDKVIIYQMTPVAVNGAEGDPVTSAKLVDFNMSTTQFSSADSYAQLVTDPVFSSEDGLFRSDSLSATIVGDRYYFPSLKISGEYPVSYRLDLDEDVGGCRQKAYETLILSESVVTWNAEPRYCWDEGVVTITVSDVPDGILWDQFLLPTNMSALVSWVPFSKTAQVNISMLGEGNKKDYIEYYYQDPTTGVIFPSRYEFVIDSVGANLSLSMLDSSFCENADIKQITSDNLYPLGGSGSWSGGPSGMIVNSDNDDAYIDPSTQVGGGNVNIYYTYTSGACAKTVSLPLTIYPNPEPDFVIDNRCIQFEGDPTRFINTTADPIMVKSWAWDFGLGEGLSSLQDPEHIYNTGGVKNITLKAETFFGCIGEKTISDTLAKKPVSDFTWEDDCFYADENLHLISNPSFIESVDTAFWFVNGDTLTGVNMSDPDAAYLKTDTDTTGPGVISVDYYLKTFLSGCFDVATKKIYIRPVYTIREKDYFEGFESGTLGWVVDGDPANTWRLEAPGFIDDLSSDSIWYTGIPTGDLVDYSVESPCFDFREVKRPMIKMDIIRAFDRGRDGAVLQYKEGNDPVWLNIGGADYGINWYKNSNISGRPGGSVVGWSPEFEDTTLVQARQYLDDLIGKSDVKFRISYGSDGNAQDSKGFAFDNIRIGERSRNVLVEHFTNYNASGVVSADNEMKTILDDISDDAINIQYHTNYRAGDSLYLDNTAVPSSRMLFYSLVRNPYTLFDGGTTNNFAGRYDWIIADATLEELKNRSLTDPLFSLTIDTLPSYRFNVNIKPLQEIHASNMTLYLAVVASEINGLTGDNGQTVFRNVLRKMIPDAGGIVLEKDWFVGDSLSKGPYSRNISMKFETDSVEVIAFLQNNITKEVYQAASSGKLSVDIATLIGKVGFDDATFKIFPNPASTNLTFLFDQELTGKSELRFYNNTGVVVKEVMLQPGIDRLAIDDISLPSGIYIVKLTVNNRPQGYKKLIITGY